MDVTVQWASDRYLIDVRSAVADKGIARGKRGPVVCEEDGGLGGIYVGGDWSATLPAFSGAHAAGHVGRRRDRRQTTISLNRLHRLMRLDRRCAVVSETPDLGKSNARGASEHVRHDAIGVERNIAHHSLSHRTDADREQRRRGEQCERSAATALCGEMLLKNKRNIKRWWLRKRLWLSCQNRKTKRWRKQLEPLTGVSYE